MGIRVKFTTWLLVAGSCISSVAWAGKPGTARVPPTLEIEILDPGVDPNGNPAVRIGTASQDAPDLREVDIPPVVLVHRFYYTGDRTFQGPMLPGGPSILVVNHPQSGERCYIEAQMLPGAPRVSYTKHGIEYDYGTHGLHLEFAHWSGKPTLKYRSGKTWGKRIAEATNIEECHDKMHEFHSATKQHMAHSKQVVKGAFVEVCEYAEMAVAPVRSTLEMLPLGKVLLSDDHGKRLAEKAATHERDRAVKRATRRAEELDGSIETLR